MSAESAPRKRRQRNPARVREGMEAIGAALERQIPPPCPGGLGEDMLLRARQDAMRNEAMDQGLLGRIAERSDANGRALDGLNERLNRIDDKLEGVAYRRDIEQFMVRSEIEGKIEKAVAGVTIEVNGLRTLVKWGGCGIVAAFGALLLRLIYSGAHIPI